MLETLDLAELLVVAQQLDVLREERLGELEQLLALARVAGPSGGLALAGELVGQPRVVEPDRELGRDVRQQLRAAGLERRGVLTAATAMPRGR